MRCRLAMIGLIALVPIGGIAAWWSVPSSPINEANCKLIEIGMPIQSVEQMLGGVGEDYYSEVSVFKDKRLSRTVFWRDGHQWIVVTYREGKVEEAAFWDRTIMQRLDDWYLGREWSPWGTLAQMKKAA